MMLGGLVASSAQVSAQAPAGASGGERNPENLWWSAPRGCPQRAEIRRSVSQMLGANKRLPADLRIVGRLRITPAERREQRFRLVLSLDAPGTQGQRELTGGNCKDLSQAAAWLIALAVDPTLGSDAGPDSAAAPEVAREWSETAASPETHPPKAAPNSAPHAEGSSAAPIAERSESGDQIRIPTSRRNSRERTPFSRSEGGPPSRWWRVGLHAGLWSARLPGPQAALGVNGGIARNRAYIEARYDYSFTRAVDLHVPGTAEFSSQALSLLACGQWGEGRFRGGPCAVVSGMRTVGQARGITESSRDVQRWAQAGLAALLGWQIHPPWELTMELGASLAVSRRPQFLIEGIGEVTRANFVTGYALLGVGLRIR